MSHSKSPWLSAVQLMPSFTSAASLSLKEKWTMMRACSWMEKRLMREMIQKRRRLDLLPRSSTNHLSKLRLMPRRTLLLLTTTKMRMRMMITTMRTKKMKRNTTMKNQRMKSL